MNAEEKLVQDLRKNEHVLHIIPFDDLVKEVEAKKPYLKIAANLASPIKDSATATKLIMEFGIKPDKVLIKQYGGKQYIVFKGYPSVRKILTGSRYLPSDPKVVRMAVGPKGVKNAIKSGFVLTVVLCVGIEIFDYFIRDTSTLAQLLGNITSDIISIGVASIAATVAGLAVGASAVLGSVAAAPIIAAIAVGLLVTGTLMVIDNKFGATKALIGAYEKLGIKLKEIESEANWWFNFFENNPRQIMNLFGGYGSYGGY
ncbi:MAG: hypothetical protein OEZ33_08995 [Gammaproteobacteria bacterium]|nr:hypothetical protein [Gammaproteobacteria bacterium]MDH5778334.1 hypothetical protein [Gammaproteobacteria bacterium]